LIDSVNCGNINKVLEMDSETHTQKKREIRVKKWKKNRKREVSCNM
jgi:hypothetical protein